MNEIGAAPRYEKKRIEGTKARQYIHIEEQKERKVREVKKS